MVGSRALGKERTVLEEAAGPFVRKVEDLETRVDPGVLEPRPSAAR